MFFLRYYLVNMDDWPVVARVRAEFVHEPYPAGGQPRGAAAGPIRAWLIEIEALAATGE